MSSELQVEAIRSLAELDALGGEWNELLTRSRNRSAFLSFEWIRAWVQAYLADESELFVLLVKNDGSLFGLAPWRIVRRKGVLFPLRRIEFLGAEGAASDHLDVICKAGKEENVVSSIYGFLYGEGRALWDTLRLSDLQATSALIPHLMKCVDRDGKYVSVAPSSYCPQFRLPASADELLQSKSHKHRRNFTRDWERFLASGTVEFERISGNGTRLLESFESIYGFHEANYGNNPRIRALFEALFSRPGGEDLCRIDVVRVDGVLLGGFIQLAMADRIGLYVVAIDREAGGSATRVVPMLLRHVLEGAVADGIEVYDFLRGVEQYKLFWANEISTAFSIDLVNAGWKAFPDILVSAIKRFVKLIFR